MPSVYPGSISTSRPLRLSTRGKQHNVYFCCTQAQSEPSLHIRFSSITHSPPTGAIRSEAVGKEEDESGGVESQRCDAFGHPLSRQRTPYVDFDITTSSPSSRCPRRPAMSPEAIKNTPSPGPSECKPVHSCQDHSRRERGPLCHNHCQRHRLLNRPRRTEDPEKSHSSFRICIKAIISIIEALAQGKAWASKKLHRPRRPNWGCERHRVVADGQILNEPSPDVLHRCRAREVHMAPI